MALDRQLFLTALAALAAGCDDLGTKCAGGGSGGGTANCIGHTGPIQETPTPTPTGEGYGSGSYYTYTYSYTYSIPYHTGY